MIEFIEGAARLRGNAKALDIWRIETKLEVLIEEVLNKMETILPGLDGNKLKLQDVFDNSLRLGRLISDLETSLFESLYIQ